MATYTIRDFERDFPDDEACLAWLVQLRWPDGITCKKCQKVTNHYYIEGRKSYSCQECGNHVHPTAGTIYHKSRTPLPVWFYAVYLIVSAGGEITARKLEHDLGVTYKTAWRMRKLIKERLADEDLSGIHSSSD
ncbi:MAG: IS1595 family transposase [Chloroflexota bacterium]